MGSFTLAFGAYLIVLGFSRALVSQPLLTLPSRLQAGDASIGASATATGWLGAAGGAVCILVGFGMRRLEFVAVGLFMLPLCLQDLLRFVFFQTGRPWHAALLDGIWLLASLAGFTVIESQGSPALAVVLWGIGAMLAAVPGLLILRVRVVSPTSVYRWWRFQARRLAIGLALESIAYHLGSQAGLWIIVALLGNSDLGQLKATQTILGPATLVLGGFTVLTIPRIAQSAGRSSSQSMLGASATALILVGAASAGLVWIGPWAARVAFGSDLPISRSLFLPVAAQVVASALAVGPTAVLMVQQRGGTLAIVRATSGAIGLVAVAVASAGSGIAQAAWALALSALLFALGAAAAVPVILRRLKA